MNDATTFELIGLARPYRGEKTDEIIWELRLGNRHFRKAIFMSPDEEDEFLQGNVAGYFEGLLRDRGWLAVEDLGPNARLITAAQGGLE